MNDIPRYSVAKSEMCPVGEEAIEIVTYADHVAAVAEAEQQAGEQSHGHYMDGYAAALDAARDAVIAYSEERIIKTGHPNMSEDITAALRVAAARIDALRGAE